MKKSNVNILIVMILDVLFIAIAGFLALFVRYDFTISSIDPKYLTRLIYYLPVDAVISIIVFMIGKMYRFVWHFVSTNDVARMVISVTISSAINLFVILVLSIIDSEKYGEIWYFLPRSVAFMMYVFKLVFLVGIRCSVRFISMFQRSHSSSAMGNIMIIGAGDAGNILIRDIENNHQDYGKICCIIDDNKEKHHRNINGIPIIGGRENIQTACEKFKIDEIIFAIPTISAKDKKEILDICKETGCKVKALPSVYQLYTGEVQISDIKDVEINDLLGREEVQLDKDKVGKLISHKTVLITGGGGSIGSELARQVAKNHPKKLVLLDNYENNVYDVQQELKRKFSGELNLEVIIASVREKQRIEEIFDIVRPDIVFHAAAHKHVPLMEDSPSEAVKNNIFGTYHVVRASEKYKVKKFIMISTDKAVNPTSVMGATKRFCEMILQSRAIAQARMKKEDPSSAPITEFASVRFGNVLGSNGSVVPLFKKQIEEGGPVTITDRRITRFFMTIPEAAQLVLEAGAIAKENQIFVLDMGEPVKIIDLAENLIKLSGLKPYTDIEIKEVGLRPGEKLYEELLMKSETLSSTENKKIFVEEQSEIDPDKIKADLKLLDKAVSKKHIDEDGLVTLLKEMIPTYKEE